MPRARCRKPTLLDAIVGVAATAIALAWCRMFLAVYDDGQGGIIFELFPRGTGTARAVLGAIWSWIVLTTPFAMMGTFALLIMRLRRPRRDLRRLLWQPGTAACLATSWVFVVGAVEHVATFGLLEWDSVDGSWRGFLDMVPVYIWESAAWARSAGAVIAAVWMLMRLGRRWRREPGWIDGAGMCLGVYWLTAMPFSWFADFP